MRMRPVSAPYNAVGVGLDHLVHMFGGGALKTRNFESGSWPPNGASARVI
jgi:hypothetical protein